MRQLQVEEMYLLSEIADKMDFQFPKYPKISKKMSDEEKDALMRDYGSEIVTFLVRKIYKAKNEVNQLIAAVTEKSVEDVKKMPSTEFTATLKEIMKQPGIFDFFK